MSTKEEIRLKFTQDYGFPPEYFMEMVATTMITAENGYGPFATMTISLGGKILHIDHDRVKDIDPWAHAEFNNVAALCGPNLPKLPPNIVVVASSEPCPFCFNLLQKAKVATIVFGARTEPTSNWPKPMEDAIRESNYKPHLIADVNSEFMTKKRTELLNRLSQV